MSLKFAIIGCGRISPNHLAAALVNELDIVALCDIEESKMNEAIERHELPIATKKYVDYKEMLNIEKPKLVAICTESGKHGQIALDCIEAGANLIIEKPIALSLEEADKIIEKANEKNIKVSACHQNRFNKSVQKIREAVEDNRFGRLMHGTAHIRWNRGEDYYKQAPWRGTWEQDGGALMNQCIHNIDLLRWMMGDNITEVVGMTDNLIHGFIDAEDLGMALVKFANGSYGIIEGTTNIYPQNLEETLYIFGDKGTVKAGGKSVNLIEEWQFADNLDNPEEVKEKYHENPPTVYGFGHNPLYADVIDAIKNDRQPYVTALDGRNALELVLAIYKSAAEGKSVQLPLDKCGTLDFKGRFDR
ncbi:Gfo/Idh/MocA family oxidoreductase [Serpentinicella sp. ANB-PHB4]|uniref:Gfo/Idh/MocA family protein n=1 Tax=Serpentinicella sp. ANB-PHB4 TaxID=3074076 RepID=UPI00285FAF8A|nr:Gfo/Idh/MocA family oxidoreductase [Serpentinicella sp. ANB-PHB4]MDR5658764.1 Gfo/Idh/MocA family oxidoreductase [Serpentinicella sp. ANB-PHB4]